MTADQMPAGSATQGSHEQIAALPEPIHLAVTAGFAEALQTTFLAAVPFARSSGSSSCSSYARPHCDEPGETARARTRSRTRDLGRPDARLSDDEEGPRSKDPHATRENTPPSLAKTARPIDRHALALSRG